MLSEPAPKSPPGKSSPADSKSRPSSVIATRRRGRSPVPALVAVVALFVAALLNATELVGDQAVVNLATISLLGIAVIVPVAWLVFASGLARSARWSIGAIVLVLVGAFFTVFRIAGVSGDLIPRFALRFGDAPATAVAPVAAVERADAGGAVDMRTTTPDDFPQFLGPQRNNAVEHPRLALDWKGRPPELIWRHEIGAGWAGFAVVNGFAVTLEQRDADELVTCYELLTGKLRWSFAVPARYDTVIAGTGPRSTPTIDEGLVYTLGGTAHLTCLDGATGRPVWEQDLLENFRITPADEEGSVRFGRANSPLIAGNLVIVPIGGPLAGPHVSLVAFDKRTGKQVWTGGERNASYSSPILATLRGVPQVLSVNEDFVSSHDPATGAVLWEFPWQGSSHGDANVSQPVPVDDDRVFISKGYFRGAALFEINRDESGAWRSRELWKNTQVLKTKFTNVVIHNDHVYGLSDGILECVELATGKRAWKTGRYGHGQILRAADLLLALSESGDVLLIEPTPLNPNHVFGQFPALTGKTWNTFALAGPYLLVRNGQEAACFRLPVRDEPARESAE